MSEEILTPEIIRETDEIILEIRYSDRYVFERTIAGYRFSLYFNPMGCLASSVLLDPEPDAVSEAIIQKFWGAFL